MLAKGLLASLKTWQLALCEFWDLFATANRLRQRDQAIRVGSLEDDGGMSLLLPITETQRESFCYMQA